MSVQLPAPCIALQQNVDSLIADLNDLEDQLKAAPHDKDLLKQIADQKNAIAQAKRAVETCIQQSTGPIFGPGPTPTKPSMSTNTTPVQKTKTISLDLMQKKFDEFFNNRTDRPILLLRLDNDQNPGGDPPNSFAEMFFIVSAHNM